MSDQSWEVTMTKSMTNNDNHYWQWIMTMTNIKDYIQQVMARTNDTNEW